LVFARNWWTLTTIMKKITVQWVPEAEWGYDMAMRVIESNHPRFIVGSRFDFGFFSIATREGYVILSLPLKEPIPE
jgi:hypothetical protein